MLKPIGILGGTFDPVHHGHLRLAIECMEELGFAEVRMIPVHTPPHRRPPVAPPSSRLHMLRLAVEGVAGLVADDREVRRGGLSYTIDTLEPMRAEHGDRPLCLIMGMDAFRSLHTWKHWERLPGLAHIVIAHRGGNRVDVGDGEEARLFESRFTSDPDDLAQAAAGRVLTAEIPMLEIAASHIRTAIAAGRDVHFLLPGSVSEYIEREGLYRSIP